MEYSGAQPRIPAYMGRARGLLQAIKESDRREERPGGPPVNQPQNQGIVGRGGGENRANFPTTGRGGGRGILAFPEA